MSIGGNGACRARQEHDRGRAPRTDRAAYLKVITSLIPKDLSIKVDAYAHMTDEELMARLKDLGGQDGTASLKRDLGTPRAD